MAVTDLDAMVNRSRPMTAKDRKVIMAGCLIAAVNYFPVFKLLTATANPAPAVRFRPKSS